MGFCTETGFTNIYYLYILTFWKKRSVCYLHLFALFTSIFSSGRLLLLGNISIILFFTYTLLLLNENWFSCVFSDGEMRNTPNRFVFSRRSMTIWYASSLVVIEKMIYLYFVRMRIARGKHFSFDDLCFFPCGVGSVSLFLKGKCCFNFMTKSWWTEK